MFFHYKNGPWGEAIIPSLSSGEIKILRTRPGQFK